VANEISIARRFLTSRLTTPSIPGIGSEVYARQADEDAADTFITFTHMGGPVYLDSGGDVNTAQPLYLVTVHGRADVTTLDDLSVFDDAIRAQLPTDPDVPVTQDGYTVECWPDERGSFEDEKPEFTVDWLRTGGFYRLFIEKIA
jgi:hypothetical protein